MARDKTMGRKPYLTPFIPEGAEPQEYFERIPFEEIEFHRYFDCPNYRACLDHAVRSYWENFTCNQCQLFVHLMNTLLERKELRRTRWTQREEEE